MPDPAYLFVRQIMQLPGVRKKLDEVADRLATRVTAVAQSSASRHDRTKVTRNDGTRPKGRPYARVGLSQTRRLDAEGELARAQGLGEDGTDAKVRNTFRGPRI